MSGAHTAGPQNQRLSKRLSGNVLLSNPNELAFIHESNSLPSRISI